MLTRQWADRATILRRWLTTTRRIIIEITWCRVVDNIRCNWPISDRVRLWQGFLIASFRHFYARKRFSVEAFAVVSNEDLGSVLRVWVDGVGSQ